MAVIVLGRQRSGTTVFRHLLSSDPRFVDVGEILHNRFLAQQVSGTQERFYRHLYELVQKTPELIHPGHHRRLLADFLQEVEGRHPGKHVLVDVKYNLLFMIAQNSLSRRNRPALLDVLRQRKDPIIHIIRRNKLRLLVSEKMANETGQWALHEGGAAPVKRKIALDPGSIVQLIKQELAVETDMANALRDFDKIMTLYYEDLFDAEGLLAMWVAEQVGEFLDENYAFSRAPKMRKQNPEALGDIVVNSAEVLAKLEVTPFAWMWRAA